MTDYSQVDAFVRKQLREGLRDHGPDDVVLACFRVPGPFETAYADVPKDDVISSCARCGVNIHHIAAIPAAVKAWCLECVHEVAGPEHFKVKWERDVRDLVRFLMERE